MNAVSSANEARRQTMRLGMVAQAGGLALHLAVIIENWHQPSARFALIAIAVTGCLCNPSFSALLQPRIGVRAT